MNPEARVKLKVKALLAKFDCLWQHWPVQTGYGAPTLDCTGAIRGKAFAIETKAPGKKPTPRQELTIAEMRRAGIAVFVIGETETYKKEHPYSGMEALEVWLTLQ